MHILQQEPRRGHSAQNLPPCRQHRIRDLCKVVETGKDDVLMRCALQMLIGAEPLRWGKAQMRLRQTQNLLCEIGLFPGRVAEGITQEVIHRRKPRRIEVSDARELHRRRLIRRDHQCLSARRMSRQIKEDVDPIGMDMCRRLLWAALRQIFISVRHPGDPVRHLAVLPPDIVEMDGEARSVVGRKELYSKVQDNVVRHVRRKIADAQLFTAMRHVGKLRQCPKHLCVCCMGIVHHLIRNAVHIVEVHQIVAQCSKAIAVVLTRQLPRQSQVRQCGGEVGQPVEQLPHALMQFPCPLLREHIVPFDVPQYPQCCFQMSCCHRLFHRGKDMTRGTCSRSPTRSRWHDNIPPFRECSVPDP